MASAIGTVPWSFLTGPSRWSIRPLTRCAAFFSERCIGTPYRRPPTPAAAGWATDQPTPSGRTARRRSLGPPAVRPAEPADGAGDLDGRARLEEKVGGGDAFVGAVLGVEVGHGVGVAERDEPVRHAPVGLAHDVAVAEAIAQRGQEPRLGVVLGEEVLDRLPERRVGARHEPAARRDDLELVAARAERGAHLGLELLAR